MTWEKMTYWKNGGIIGIVLAVVKFFYDVFVKDLFCDYPLCPGCLPVCPTFMMYVIYLIVYILIGFIFGAIVGLIYEKIKLRLKKSR